MRFPYALAVAGGLVLPTAILAQTTPAPTPTPAQAQAPSGSASGGGRRSPLRPTSIRRPLYRMNGVGKSLNLTQDQINGLNKLTDQTQAQYRDSYSKLNTLNGADRAARAQELNQQYYGEWNQGCQNILNDNQRLRYQQLNYQYGGFNALTDPDVQKRLNLTPAQVKDFAEQRLEQRAVARDQPPGSDQSDQGRANVQHYWKQRQERFDKFLTPEQQKAWRNMTGEPYTFQSNVTPSR